MDRDLQTRFARDITGLPALRQQGDQDFAARTNELSAFMRERDRVPEAAAAHDASEARLGSWLDGQRAADRRGRLSAQRAGALQGVLGRGWSSER
ncbi:Helicase associated domain protein [Sinomonas atrocyanea]|jgi:hypothetical protein|uniref:Helicase associated domain protein n=1 Tax=Sinomonas atrocyanea TaxID=37927 RepID=UPI0027827054|nr:Helicase associated domain protein [Sinomonas atrocyanea]MDQ0261343.1 hypothetical protein [Sinomonas atrocyanea]MDR6622959.1 hypothetical protein [Sinomonas atrocyanea]